MAYHCSNPNCEKIEPHKDYSDVTCYPDQIIENRKNFMKCGNCLITRYCSVDCQKKHWKIHKPICYPPKNTDKDDMRSKNTTRAKETDNVRSIKKTIENLGLIYASSPTYNCEQYKNLLLYMISKLEHISILLFEEFSEDQIRTSVLTKPIEIIYNIILKNNGVKNFTYEIFKCTNNENYGIILIKPSSINIKTALNYNIDKLSELD